MYMYIYIYIYIYIGGADLIAVSPRPAGGLLPRVLHRTPNVPTKITPTKIRWPNISGKCPMDMRIPPLNLRDRLSQTL